MNFEPQNRVIMNEEGDLEFEAGNPKSVKSNVLNSKHLRSKIFNQRSSPVVNLVQNTCHADTGL
jgi:hypothetical protein